MVWKNRGIAEMKFDYIHDRLGAGCNKDGNEVYDKRGDDRRQEGVRSLPVRVFHLAIPTASIVCGSF